MKLIEPIKNPFLFPPSPWTQIRRDYHAYFNAMDQIKQAQLQKDLYNADKIAQVGQAQFSITTANGKRPIIATCGCGPCVAVGGYEPKSKAAFLVHFSTPQEVLHCIESIETGIRKYVHDIKNTIQLHLRGGIKDTSEDIIEAIFDWKKKSSLQIEITSQDILV